MSTPKSPLALRLYIGSLFGLLVAVLAVGLSDGFQRSGETWLWLVLVSLFALTEASTLFFYDGRERVGLSASEALLFPMVVALSFDQVVVGVTLALCATSVLRRREGWQRALFNIGNFGVASAAAATIWSLLNDGADVFSIRNAVSATLAVLTYSVLTHLLTSGAISLATHKPFLRLTRVVAPATLWNLAGNLTLGLFFAAAYETAHWTVVVFPLPLAGLYLGYRAVLRQSGERERIESIHAAGRALVLKPALEDALSSFLGAIREIIAAAETRCAVTMDDQLYYSSVGEDGAVTRLQLASGGALTRLLESFRRNPAPVIVRRDEESSQREIAESMGALSMLAVPVLDKDEVVGCLIGIDRVGAEDYDEDDAKFLQALANELALSLDSYRLFAQVSSERERFQRIFQGSKEGICLLDETGKVRAWSPALEKITGYSEPEMIGIEWSQRLTLRDRDHQRVEGLSLLDILPDEEVELVTRSGPSRWISLVSGPVHSGREQGWVLLVRDVTAEHAAEEAKGDFLATISHELRTPLTTIKGSLQVLSRPRSDPYSEVGRQMVTIMRRGTDRLERLLMNLLVVSQMETGEVQVFMDEVPIQDAIRNRAQTILEDHPDVRIVAPDQTLIVRADRERLFQVIDHLLDNAHKFGGAENPITVEVTHENGYAVVAVRDLGPGIPEADHERIFERFTRLGHLLTRETQGAGVGLFIAKRSVEAMSGSIWLESEPGRGSTFYARLPLARPMIVTDSADSA